MRVLVIGAGRMGFNLAQRLDEEGHAVFVVERDSQCIERMRTRLDVMAVQGSGSSLRALKSAGVENADLMIAASGSDEVNILACLLARQIGIQRRIARVESDELLSDIHETEQEVLGVSEFINPTQVTVNRLCNMVVTPGTTESAEFAGGEIVLRALRVREGSELVAAPLRQLNALFAAEFRVAAVRRGPELFVPRGDFQIQIDDIVYVILRADSLDRFIQVFNFRQPRSDKIFIYGAGRIGRKLAERLETQVGDVLLLDPDPGRCEAASEMLGSTSVIQGSPQDRALLEDLKMEGVGYFLALSPEDEGNLAAALTAKRLGARDVLMMTGNPEDVMLYETLPFDGVVSPLLLSVGAILRSVREGRVLSLFNIAGDRGEAIEVEAVQGAPGVGKPLMEIAFPEGAMVAAAINKNGAQVAAGGTVIEPGDRVVLVSLHQACEAAISLFSQS